MTISSAFGPQQRAERRQAGQHWSRPRTSSDPHYRIPIYSLYGKVRRPTRTMMDSADVFLFDLQDLGCRIYTFVTFTLLYLLEEAAETGKEVWVLDRPNPAGRPVEGTLLVPGQESFVGAAPMPMRHGLTMGENGPLVHRPFRTRRCISGGGDEGLAARCGWQLGLAGVTAMDQSQPQCRQCQHGALLCRHRDAGRHYAVGKGAGPRGPWRCCSARPTSTPKRC